MSDPFASDGQSLDPAGIHDEIDRLCRELDRIGKGTDGAIDRLGEAEDAWEVVYDGFLERVTDEFARSKERMPGEARLQALCRAEYREAWRELNRARRHKEKLEREATLARAQLSGRQSQLAALRAEATVG